MAAAIAGVAAAGVLGLAGCGSEEAGSSPPPTTSQEETTPETTSPAEENAAWFTSVGPEFQSLQDHLDSVSTAAGASDVMELTAQCRGGLDDVTKLQSADPLPSNAELWDAALDDFQLAFSYCVAGDYTSATAYLTAGGAKLDRISDELP
ncbi:hypothetical protein M4V62_06765 [Streptomyces durmitorensis]|uniref:Lipoprotein n=1 Tax=Streptomyces durmitorensis TaxID=319947 RepID=A0ABY4PLY9_9ACTN|nr:hypothetical protein [Streptomyces durmitorensis]UQT54818.1 hypothetical protein M4V62_06765 [Streptomyces durmitorensis]